MKEVTDATWKEEVLEAKGPVLVDFWATWCGPCVALTPTLEALATENEGKVTIVKMNVEQNTEVPAEFGIRSIPTLLLFKEGKMVASMGGARPKPILQDFIDKNI